MKKQNKEFEDVLAGIEKEYSKYSHLLENGSDWMKGYLAGLLFVKAEVVYKLMK